MIKNVTFLSSLVATAGLNSGREDHPSTRTRLARWTVVLTLAMTLGPGTASAQEDDTVTISGVFSMDTESGMYDISPELFTVYINGHEHTWRLTLHGTTQSHYSNGSYYATEINAVSYDLKFFGPDAATLNAVVNDRLAGLDASAYLQNTYYETGGGLAIMHVWVGQAWGGNLYFYSGHDIGVDTLFPADPDGYPVVGPEPFSIKPDCTELAVSELFSGWYGGMGSLAGPVTFAVLPDAPSLSITSSNNVVVVSWPSTSTGFFLQQNNQLNTTNWVTPMETVTDTGILKFITVDPAVGSRFFRLFKP